ncbi:HET-domain-containing protein, partial [Lepidopterella palustris CBS 459.81]
MVLAAYWLQSCMRKHKACSDFQRKGPLPSRIIDISDPQNPILTEGSGSNEPYITLSYKWGETRRYTTTTQNLMRHTTLGIPLDELPQTFKDAIFVASSLGFRWIWIDALCICQDFPGEQLREMNRMDTTFQISTLTIFATAGDDADTGLMSIRDPRWVKPCKLTIKTTLEGKTAEGPVYITIDRGEMTNAPLYNRGWVLQEQVLAHRGLMFESRALHWRCFCDSASEAFPSRTSHKDPMPDRTPWQRDNHYDAWYEMVTTYNTRALTYETDVLSALAGLAKAMVTTHGCTYYAGLWKEDLQTGLCWYVTGSNYSNCDVRVASKESLPSWTWIS